MSTIKTKTAAPIIQSFQMQTAFFGKSIDGISEESATKIINKDVNHIAWIAGHIVSCRYMLCGMMGLQVTEPYPEIFGNLKGIQEATDYPPLSSLLETLNEVTEQLIKKLSEMDEEELHKEAFGGRLIDIILFFAYHEAYHIGQIGMLRKALGYEAIKHN